MNFSYALTLLHHTADKYKKSYKSFKILLIVNLLLLKCFECTLLDDKNMGRGSKKELKYVWGDALDYPETLGPNGKPYPWDFASKIAIKQRIPRSLFEEEEVPLISPEETRKILLKAFQSHHFDSDQTASSFGIRNGAKGSSSSRKGRSKTTQQSEKPDENEIGVGGNEGCVPSRLCPTSYNTTAPMYGISLTSGQPVTIVQKFPDLLQQVVYQVCQSSECDVIHGECVQTYLPYLFLVIPLGPVTLTGQDYVLVESGCACRPKYAKRQDEPPPLPFIQPFNSSRQRTNKRF